MEDKETTDILNSNFYGNKNGYISLIIFVDEVSFSKSSNLHKMYAILCQIAELPPNLRSSYKNIIPLAFIVGNCPDFNIVFQDFLTELKIKIEEKAEILVNNYIYTLRILAFVADAPARAKVLNITRFNGAYGCFHCLNPGLNINQRGNKRIYLTKEYPTRTNNLYNEQVKQALIEKKVICGIRNSTYLSNWLTLPDTCILDYMHLCLEGTVKSMLGIWLNSSNSKKDFYLGNY